MRVLHVTPYFAPAFGYGGPPRSVLALCKALQRAGEAVSVITTTADGDAELPPAIDVPATVDDIAVTYLPRSFPKRYFRSEALGRLLDRQAAGRDLVHIHGCWNFFGWRAARWCHEADVPYVISPRGMLSPWSFKHGRVGKWVSYRALERSALRHARLIHATSRQEAQWVTALDLGVDVVTVPNGLDDPGVLDLERAGRWRLRLGIDPNDFVILFLGRLHPKKGLETLTRAMPRVLAHVPNTTLLIVGAGEPAFVAGLHARAEPLVTAGRIRFLGHLTGTDRRLALACADAFSLTSLSENFGMSIAEAMAAALPVVVSRDCPWPEIDQWRAGFWVENTPAAVAAALMRLASDRAAARVMGENGRRAIRRHLDWTRLAGEMRRAYAQAVGSA